MNTQTDYSKDDHAQAHSFALTVYHRFMNAARARGLDNLPYTKFVAYIDYSETVYETAYAEALRSIVKPVLALPTL